ncbi:MAG: sigma 54-interacting transcriptional regulator [Candidatus Brocadiae bacterium]|nr:sigma 54-interacting transcriptional regulator [Candidatus Brocadiia bacterium]
MPDRPHNKARDVILDAINEGVFTVDREWRITSFNRAAEKITGVPRAKALGQPCKDVLRASICEGGCALEQTIRTGKPVMGKAVTIVDAQGNRRSISISTAILENEAGDLIGGVETFRDLSMIEELRKEIKRDYTFEDILSHNKRMGELFGILPTIAESASTVLIEGESGTGKELFARAIHNLSPRREKPFVAVNCGALPDTLLESELFGYKAGAFTDAKKDKPGRIALAEGGSLFLDEVGDVSPALQARLLRFLEERVFEPLGSVEPVKADVRIIAATNKNLAELVRRGEFRDDLFYRINVVRLELPPLRERMEDIPLLVEHSIDRLNRVQGKEVAGITDDALACLMSHDYPGNVRELQNVVERAFVLCRSGQIERQHLPDFLSNPSREGSAEDLGFSTLQQMEAAFLMNALRRNNWNRTKTAGELGIHKSTIFRKIKSLGLKVPPRRKRADR